MWKSALLQPKEWSVASAGDKFAQQSMVVVRRMRTFYKLPESLPT
jgi:hypothetical protein